MEVISSIQSEKRRNIYKVNLNNAILYHRLLFFKFYKEEINMSFKTADLCDEFSERLAVCRQSFISYGQKKTFSGPISTVKVFEKNVLVEEALETIPKGNVLVVDGGGSKNCALLGDRLAGIGMKRELAGVIINGYVRDTVATGQMDVGVLALGSNPLRSEKVREGETDIIVNFGEVDWKPGEFVYVDEDGIVLSKDKLI